MPESPPDASAGDGLPTATVILKPKRARPFFGRHPWVLDTAIDRVAGEPAPGAVVDLATHDGTFVARGLWNAASRLRVRLYAFDPAARLDRLVARALSPSRTADEGTERPVREPSVG